MFCVSWQGSDWEFGPSLEALTLRTVVGQKQDRSDRSDCHVRLRRKPAGFPCGTSVANRQVDPTEIGAGIAGSSNLPRLDGGLRQNTRDRDLLDMVPSSPIEGL